MTKATNKNKILKLIKYSTLTNVLSTFTLKILIIISAQAEDNSLAAASNV